MTTSISCRFVVQLDPTAVVRQLTRFRLTFVAQSVCVAELFVPDEFSHVPTMQYRFSTATVYSTL